MVQIVSCAVQSAVRLFYMPLDILSAALTDSSQSPSNGIESPEIISDGL